MPKIFILTTATPRPDLHKLTCLPVFAELRKHFDVVPIVNLDKPMLVNRAESEFEKAKAQFEEAGVHLLTNERNPSFSLAARKLYYEAQCLSSGEENPIYFWLEDDWKYNQTSWTELLEAIRVLYDTDKTCILTTDYCYLGGNPCFFKKKLFDNIVKLWRKNAGNFDPEFIHFEAQKIVENVNKWRTVPKNGLKATRAVFRDLGRDWRKRQKIGKVRRDSNSRSTWIQDPQGREEL